MTVKSSIQLALATSLLCFASLAIADSFEQSFDILGNNGNITAINSDVGPIEKQNKAFTFDWNQYTTISANQSKISKMEKFIAKIDDAAKLKSREKQALGALLYKLGSYYTHIARDPDSSIAKLTAAAAFLTNKEEKAWNDNQLAYAYEQRYAASKQSADKEKSLYYTNKVLSQLYPNQKNKVVAFAYGIKGLIESDDKNYLQAEVHFKDALAIYDALPNNKDNQYLRIKNRYANSLLNQPGHEQEALAMFIQLKKFWAAKGQQTSDPYAARNMFALGRAYLKTDNAAAARDEFQSAVAIYEKVYGNNSKLMVKPYQLLAESYRKLGSLEQASTYEKKANDIVSA